MKCKCTLVVEISAIKNWFTPRIGADHITAGPPYMAVDCRRPSSSCRRCPGTTCRATSRPHHLCLFSEAVWKRASSGGLFSNFVQCPRNDSCHYWHSNRSFTY